MTMILTLDKTRHVVVEPVRYKLSYSVITTKEDLKLVYPFLIDDIKGMKFETVLSQRLGSNYRNEHEALVVFRKLYLDCMRNQLDGSHPTLRWLLASWLRRLYLISGFSTDDKNYNNRIEELFQLSNYLEVNKDEIY